MVIRPFFLMTVVFWGLLNLVNAQAPEILWSQTFGSEYFENGYDIIQTPEGDYLILGHTAKTGDDDIILIKADVNGNVIWTKTYGGALLDRAYSIVPTTDGGYIFTGRTENYGATISEVLLIKVDKDGNEEWLKTYGGSSFERANSVLQTDDGGFIVLGRTYSYGSGLSDFYVIKTDSIGTQEWYKTYGGTNAEDGKTIRPTSDGGYILAGETQSYGAGNADVYVVKIDAQGNEIWSKAFGNSEWNHGTYVEETQDGDFIITGRSWSYDFGQGFDLYLIKTNAAGDSLWTKYYEGEHSDFASSLVFADDGGYIIGGYAFSVESSSHDFYLTKVSEDGEQLWINFYGGGNHDYGKTIIRTQDGGFAMIGKTLSYAQNESSDIWLVKLSSELVNTKDEKENYPNQNYTLNQNYPNPFYSSTSITYSLKQSANVELTIRDLFGRKVAILVDDYKRSGEHTVSFRGSDIPQSIYLYELKVDGKCIDTKKMYKIN